MSSARHLALANTLLFSLAGCGAPQQPASSPPAIEPQPKPPRPACLVLSVGAEKGLAHIGVIEALKEKNVPIDCVVGTSMGSLVGALYASAPQQDTSEQYRALFRAYVKETKAATAQRGFLWFLAGAAAVALSGGAAGPALATGAGAGAVGAATTEEKDIERLREVMNSYFRGKRIEELPIAYRTIHQRVGDTGMSQVPIRGGNLAKEVSWSVANPLIFPGIELESGARIDPGADRVAAIPLEYACAEFPEHQFVVSNVTGEEIFTSKEMNCPYSEVRPKSLQVDRGKAIIGEDPEFSALVQSGYDEALATLDWTQLPHESA